MQKDKLSFTRLISNSIGMVMERLHPQNLRGVFLIALDILEWTVER